MLTMPVLTAAPGASKHPERRDTLSGRYFELRFFDDFRIRPSWYCLVRPPCETLLRTLGKTIEWA